MLNACAHTPAHIGVLWWFMCDREWFSLSFFLTSFIMYMRVFGPCLHTFFFIQFNLLFYLLPSRFLWIWSLATVFSWQRFLVVVSCCIHLTLYHFWCFSVVALSLSLCFLLFNLIIWFVHFLWFYFYCIHFCGACVRACARASGILAFVFQHSVTFMGCNVPWIRMRHANNIEHEKKSQHRTNSNLITIQKERADQASTDKSKCKWWTLVVCTSHGYLRT